MVTHGAPHRPAGLTAICVIAIVLGGLGLLGGLVGAVSIVFGPELQTLSRLSNPTCRKN